MTFAQPFSAYEILERIGSGAMGTVFKARHRQLNKIVALKVLRPSLARDARYAERLRREARIVASLDHPNIVGGYDLGEEGGYHFFVMEYVQGRSLRELLAEWGMFPEAQVLDVGIQVAAALDHAFQRGVIHRDVKPGNILIADRNQVKLTDMGLAKGPTDATITRDGGTVGTPQYISPEQARSPQAADIRSDLYSLGATLYHMATGSPPFRGETMAEVITKVLHERAPSVTDLNPNISPGLGLVIRKLLAKDPGLRYQTPAELLDDLRRVERSEAPRVDRRRLEAIERSVKLRRVLWVSSVAIVVVAAAVTWAWPRPAPVVRPDADGLRGLVDRGAQARTFQQRLALLRETTVEQVHPQSAAELRRLREQLESQLHSDLAAFWQRYEAGEVGLRAEQWFMAPENWRTPERFWTEAFAVDLAQQLGVRGSDLPAALRERFEQSQAALRERAQAWQEARDAAWRRRLDDFLARELPAAWAGLLEASDFVGAERTLQSALDGFFSGEGLPTREQLPDALRAYAAECETGAVRSARAVIEREEARVAADLSRRVESALAELDAKRRDLRPARANELLQAIKIELSSEPAASAFRPAQNPWRGIEAALARAEQVLASDARLEEAEVLDQAASRAYRTLLATGVVQEARGWLEHLTLQDQGNDATRDRHVALLAAAETVERQLLETLTKRGKTEIELRRARDPRAVKFTAVLVAVPEGIRLAERGADALRPLPSGLVCWADLLAAVGGRSWLDGAPVTESEAWRRGLALWLLVTGDEAETMRLLDDAERAFFANHVVAAIDHLRDFDPQTDAPALTLLQALRRAYDQPARDLTAVQSARVAFGERHDDGVLSGDARTFLREVDGWIDDEHARQALEAQVRASTPAATVVADSARQVCAVFDLARLAELGLPAGWSRAGAELAFDRDDVDLSEASGRLAIEFDTRLGQSVDLAVELAVRFPPLPDDYRLYLLEVHGVLVGFGMLRDGSGLAVLLPADAIDRPAELRKALQAELERAINRPLVRVVAGAEHRLRLHVLNARHRVKASVALDGVELVNRTLPRLPKPSARVRLMPLQPWRVRGIEVRAIVERR